MAEVIRMPRMSDTMEEGVLVQWLVKKGDTITTGDVLAEVETDKATMELESYNEGVLLYIGVEEGASVPIDAILAVVGEEGEDYQSLLEGQKGKKEEQDSAEEKEESTASEVEEDEQPDQQEPISQKQEASVKEVQPQQAQPKANDKGNERQQERENEHLKASPLAKMLAKKNGVEIGSVKGTGDGGRIIKRDVVAALEGEQEKDNRNEQPRAIPPKEGASEPQGAYEEVKVSSMRKTIARRLAESKYSAPHFYLTVKVDCVNLWAFRKNYNEASSAKISFNDIIMKAVGAALLQHPAVNSSWLGDTIRYNHNINIGMAVAVDEGLLVPVIRNVERKGLLAISKEAVELGDKARSKKLSVEEMSGNTFTVSNLGMLGIEEFTAIINPPDACILAVGAIADEPVVDKSGAIVPGRVMRLTLSCDHRVVDGAIGARFLQTLVGMLEQPMLMLG